MKCAISKVNIKPQDKVVLKSVVDKLVKGAYSEGCNDTISSFNSQQASASVKAEEALPSEQCDPPGEDTKAE